MEEGKESLNGHQVHQFREVERTLVGVSDPQDPEVVLLGFSGFGLSLVYDNERLRTVPDIQNAAENLVAHLVQLVVDEKLGAEAARAA